MTHYRIISQGRQWFCEAADADAANRDFRRNLPDASEAELATLVDIDTLLAKQNPVTVNQPQPKKKRRIGR
jgi:hypothetical protein